MSYTKVFDPPEVAIFETPVEAIGEPQARDRRDGDVYVYPESLVLAVNVAIVTGRPLLIYGPPGSGKSSVARNIARVLGWAYYEEVITSRTQARDLLWRFDALRRLSDAQVNRLHDDRGAYVEPGVLWWAFDPVSARSRHEAATTAASVAVSGATPTTEQRAVVLLDEIDKADPDVPNNLLVPLGSLRFEVEETGATIRASAPPLVVITTNRERELPNAFLRRCVVAILDAPAAERLVQIATVHFGPDRTDLYIRVAEQVVRIGGTPRAGSPELPAPSTAEYLDAIRACRELGIDPAENDPVWQNVFEATVRKTRDRRNPS